MSQNLLLRMACGLLVIIAMPGCARLDQPTTPTIQATRSQLTMDSSIERVFTNTLSSPDSRVTLVLTCRQSSVDIPHCETTFPNGEVMRGEYFTWLPNNRFLLVCVGAFHDSPCGYLIWDAVNGKKLGRLYYLSYHQLSPDGNYLAYLTPDEVNNAHFALLDLKSGEEQQDIHCPGWVKLPETVPQVCADRPLH